jgi:hypothetical protein
MEKSICTVCSSEFTRSEYVYLGYAYCPNCALQSNAVRAIRCLIRKAGPAISTNAGSGRDKRDQKA